MITVCYDIFTISFLYIFLIIPYNIMEIKNNILEYDLFIFDFDGTIVDTEKYHCKAWNYALNEMSDIKMELKLYDFHKYFHSLDKNLTKYFLKIMYHIENYDKIYEIKQKYYINLIENQKEKIEFIEGVEFFLNFLIKTNKDFIIVTNTSKLIIDIFRKTHDIINHALHIYTKDLFVNKKPNPECYLFVSEKYKKLKKIGFEDSFIGMEALYQIKDITPVFICNKDYYYNDDIQKKYKNCIVNQNYDLKKLNDQLYNFQYEFNFSFIHKILKNNIMEMNYNFENMANIIYQISILINNMNENGHIYLSGMGKSGYVCKKSASTWQSLSLKCSYIDLPNLPHGDFGLFRDNDLFILISNSGNTEEIIYILQYLKKNLKKKITTISIVANINSEMEKWSDFTYILNPINEADQINMTPSTSSLIFMALLDAIAINIKKNITKEEFQIAHPKGSLGKK